MTAIAARGSKVAGGGGWLWGARIAAGIALLSAFSQGAVLAICAAVGGSKGLATVLHRVGAGYDVAAWYYPTRGVWGLVITLAEMATVLASMVMVVSRVGVRRRTGLVLMAGWGAFWAWRIGRVAWFTGDGVDFGLAGLAALALACQVVMCVKWWREGPRGPRVIA